MEKSRYAYVILANLLDYPEILMFKENEGRQEVWTLPGIFSLNKSDDLDFLNMRLHSKLPDLKFLWESRPKEGNPYEARQVIEPYYTNLEGQHLTLGVSNKADVYLAHVEDIVDYEKSKAFSSYFDKINELYPGDRFGTQYLPRQRHPNSMWISTQHLLFNPDILRELYATRARSWNIGVVSREALRFFLAEYSVVRDISRDFSSYALKKEKSEKSKRMENRAELENLKHIPVGIFP